MKFTKFLFVCVILLLSIKTKAQEEMLDNGFSLKLSLGFPTTYYALNANSPIPSDFNIKNTFGLELGSQWYVFKKGHFGLAVDVNWLDVVYGQSTETLPQIGPVDFITLETSALELGPAATFAINDKWAIDGYYNIRPTYFMGILYESVDDYVLIHDFNFMHGLGLGVRFKVFYLGYEYTFGTVVGQVQSDGDFESIQDIYPTQNMDGGNSKLILGFQF